MSRAAFVAALVASSAVLSAQQDPANMYKELVEAFNTSAEQAGAPPIKKFAPRFLKAAKAFEGGDEALPFLGWLVRNVRDKTIRKKVDLAIGRRVKQAVAKLKDGDTDPAQWAKTAVRQLRQAPPLRRNSVATDRELIETLITTKTIQAVALDKRTKEQATSATFEIERLQVGMVAPDIKGNDLDGVAFKLSDYRGKVVVLDFWGDW